MVTYKLQNFPNVCVHCLRPATVFPDFQPVQFFSQDMNTTVETASLELINNDKLTAEMMYPNRNSMLPEKMCKYCLTTIVTFYQLRRRIECVRRFNVGLVKLIQGNPVDLIELFTTDGDFLVALLKNLGICDNNSDSVTVENLIEDLSSFKLIDSSQKAEYTVMDVAPAEQPVQEIQLPTAFALSVNGIILNNVKVVCNNTNQVERIAPVVNATNSPIHIISDSSDDEAEKPKDATIETAEPLPQNGTVTAVEAQPTQSSGSPVRKRGKRMSDVVYSCQICIRTFRSVNGYTGHMEKFHRTPLVPKPSSGVYPCKPCSLTFNTLIDLRNHCHATHKGGAHACTICSILFDNKDSLKTHMEIVHNTQTYFYCNICVQIFEDASELANHKILHTSPAPTTCGKCLGSFANSNDMNKHVCITYRDDFMCCGVDFEDHIKYAGHMKTKHNTFTMVRPRIPPGMLYSKFCSQLRGERFFCGFCDKKFSTDEEYQKHMVSREHFIHALVIS
ncbi:zinc finger protein 2-like [Anopheles ziemanni]|uniref:zinc finger protein 2-like n=1 Tax=Anopheles coustani TaxID=139045 RepID=UPI00265A8393|nr:zinc finger protein 2-like [Anopheles coustani]XP_058178461.1 zinc finger protein 2-like [Anopheles ziemanni]